LPLRLHPNRPGHGGCDASSPFRKYLRNIGDEGVAATRGSARGIETFFKRSHKIIAALTVQEIPAGHIAKKLADNF
jgi:hypothetical protein